MYLLSAAAGILIALATAQVGLAQSDQDTKAADSLVKAFVGCCVQIMPNLEKVEAGARVMDWKDMTGDVAKFMAPPSRNVIWKSWLAVGAADVPFIISASTGVEGKRKISACAIANPYAPPEPIQTALVKKLNLKEQIDRQDEAGQQMKSWKSSVNGRAVIVSLVDATPTREPGINISVSMIE
jgi:hypothetical protein